MHMSFSSTILRCGRLFFAGLGVVICFVCLLSSSLKTHGVGIGTSSGYVMTLTTRCSVH